MVQNWKNNKFNIQILMTRDICSNNNDALRRGEQVGGGAKVLDGTLCSTSVGSSIYKE